MDRRELEIMLNEAFDRGIVSVGHLVHETVEVGFLNELGRTVGFTLNGWKEAIETIPVDLFDSFDDGRGRERFLSVPGFRSGSGQRSRYAHPWRIPHGGRLLHHGRLG